MRHAARLYLEGKASHILASGGYIEWLGSQTPEAEGMREILESYWGAPGGNLAGVGIAQYVRKRSQRTSKS